MTGRAARRTRARNASSPESGLETLRALDARSLTLRLGREPLTAAVQLVRAASEADPVPFAVMARLLIERDDAREVLAATALLASTFATLAAEANGGSSMTLLDRMLPERSDDAW